MISSPDDHLNRLSIISSTSTSSNDSVSSQVSLLFHRFISKSNLIENKTEASLHNESKKTVYCSRQILFFGPLILFIILLISGFITFIIVGQRSAKDIKEIKQEKNINKYFDTINSIPDHDFQPISCPFIIPKQSIQTEFVLHELNCGLRRSSLIHMYYVNDSWPIKPSDTVAKKDVIVSPKVELNFNFLLKLYYNSFLLLLIDPESIPLFSNAIVLHWIRYFSSSLEDGDDICRYKNINLRIRFSQQKIVLLYATNSSIMVIRAKTICKRVTDWFHLMDYVTFVKLKLIGATNFFLLYEKDYVDIGEE